LCPLSNPQTNTTTGLVFGGQVSRIMDYATSAWAVMAIAAAGEDPHDWTADGNSVIDYLGSNADLISGGFNPTNTIALDILAITAALEDPYNFGEDDPFLVDDNNYVATLLSEDHFNGTQFGDPDSSFPSLNDDYFCVMALISAGVSPDNPSIQARWGFAPGFPSTPDDTTAALMALTATGGPSDPNMVTEALQYLHSQQGPNGGIMGWGVENGESTAWVLMALAALGEDPTSDDWTVDPSPEGTGGNLVDYLLNLQSVDLIMLPDPDNPGSYIPDGAAPDGSFIYSNPLVWGAGTELYGWTTSHSIQALVGKPWPVVTPLVFEDPVRETRLAVDPDAKAFLFNAPDEYNSGIISADFMRLKGNKLTIVHRDENLYLVARANIKKDRCLGSLWDKVNSELYVIYDPKGME